MDDSLSVVLLVWGMEGETVFGSLGLLLRLAQVQPFQNDGFMAVLEEQKALSNGYSPTRSLCSHS